jgi:hypothetical protein
MPRTMIPSLRAEGDAARAEDGWGLQLRLAAARQQVDGADQCSPRISPTAGWPASARKLLLEVRADVIAHPLEQSLFLEMARLASAGGGGDGWPL